MLLLPDNMEVFYVCSEHWDYSQVATPMQHMWVQNSRGTELLNKPNVGESWGKRLQKAPDSNLVKGDSPGSKV